MEWTNHPDKSTNNTNHAESQTNNTARGYLPHNLGDDKSVKNKSSSFYNVTFILLLFSITFVLVSVIGSIMSYRQKNESRYIAKDKMQAIFLNGGRVYFGKIKALNSQYIGVTDIYYLRMDQQVQPKQEEQSGQNTSLIKLGCELHGPQDQMLINHDQVMFWENLKDDSKIVKMVESYKQANPDGKQNCESTNQQTAPTAEPQENTNNKEQNDKQQNQITPQPTQ